MKVQHTVNEIKFESINFNIVIESEDELWALYVVTKDKAILAELHKQLGDLYDKYLPF